MNNFRILTDFHHSGLLNSLIMLFEGRLGYSLYRPIGRRWYDEGYWKIYDHPATVAQYLDIGGATPDGTPELNSVIGKKDHVYKCQDIDSGLYNKAITLDGFLNNKFDIIIASIPGHVEPFKELAKRHLDNPKLIFQIGNAWEANNAENVMASAIVKNVPDSVNFITYHQEFDLDEFCYAPPRDNKNIYSFVNNFTNQFPDDWQLFENIEQLMTEWTFKSFGGQCRDGSIGGSANVAKTMQDSRFVWHTKKGGDGFGHIIHNAPAVGRPLIVKKEYYIDKLAEPLLEDEITCIIIDGLKPDQIVKKINYWNEPIRYNAMSKRAYNKFKEIVDYDKEEQEIRQFLDNLQ
jgi:hypothetical protein